MLQAQHNPPNKSRLGQKATYFVLMKSQVTFYAAALSILLYYEYCMCVIITTLLLKHASPNCTASRMFNNISNKLQDECYRTNWRTFYNFKSGSSFFFLLMMILFINIIEVERIQFLCQIKTSHMISHHFNTRYTYIPEFSISKSVCF